MSLTKSIAKNTIIHAVGKFSASGIGIVIVSLMTRYLGTEGYGQFATIMAYLFFFTIIGDLGLYLITVNELGREQEKNKEKLFSNIFTMRLISSAVLMLAACGLIWLFPYPLIVKLGVLIFSIATFLMMLDQILVALFQEQMKTKFPAIAEIVGKILMLGLIIWFIKLNLDFLYIVSISSIGLIIHFLINLSFGRHLFKFKLRFDKDIWKKVLKKSWPVATYMLFSMLYFKADTIILSLYHSASMVGIYGAPYKILEVLIAFPAIFMGLVSPHLSRAWSRRDRTLSCPSDFKEIFQKAFDFLSIIIWPLVFGTLVLAGPIINLIAGSKFSTSTPVLQILIVATGIIFLAHLSTFAVVAINKQKQMLKYYILAAILAVILYFGFIPKYYYFAAATITVIIELFILIASWLIVRKTAEIKINFKNNLKSLLVSIIMAIIIIPLTNYLFLAILAGVVIYIGGLWVSGILHKNLISGFLTRK